MKCRDISTKRFRRSDCRGAWLRDLGFEEGAPITVKCEGGRHTIARADEIPAEYREIGAEPVMCVAEAAGVYGKEGAYV